MMQLINKDMVYVCPSRDIECGNNVNAWCDTCPKRELGPAAQPEGEAAPSVDIPFELRELLSQHADERNQGMAGPAMNAIYAWHQAKLAEAREASLIEYGAMDRGLSLAIKSVTERAEKAEAERRAAKDELKYWKAKATESTAQQAPQAGDALGKPVAYLATDLDGSGDVGFTKDIAMSRAGYGCTEIIELFDSADIDASRREAYDKGRAEGVGQAEYRPVGYAIFSDELNVRIWFGDRASALRWVSATGQSEDLLTPLYAAPPASTAQQDPIVELNVAMLRSRSALGIAKYGETLADNPLVVQGWLQHALEEALDQANYLQAAIQKLRVS